MIEDGTESGEGDCLDAVAVASYHRRRHGQRIENRFFRGFDRRRDQWVQMCVGEVHLLVHSAGIYGPAPIASISAAALEEMFRVNVYSAFYLVRDLLRAGLRNAVFIGSTAGQRGEPGHSHYAASKGAVQSMMMSIAVELAPEVRVNLVSPGWVRTPMAEQSLQRIGPALVPTLPNQRVAEVDDVVNAVLWLASDASSHCIGQDLCISGGALLVVPRGQMRPV